MRRYGDVHNVLTNEPITQYNIMSSAHYVAVCCFDVLVTTTGGHFALERALSVLLFLCSSHRSKILVSRRQKINHHGLFCSRHTGGKGINTGITMNLCSRSVMADKTGFVYTVCLFAPF